MCVEVRARAAIGPLLAPKAATQSVPHSQNVATRAQSTETSSETTVFPQTTSGEEPMRDPELPLLQSEMRTPKIGDTKGEALAPTQRNTVTRSIQIDHKPGHGFKQSCAWLLQREEIYNFIW